MSLRWNVFRYLADFSHLISVGILLYKMITRKSCGGVSLKTQILYLVVFCARYLNGGLFSPPLYNIVFKLFYIGSALAIVVLMLTKLKPSYEWRHDTFIIYSILIIPLPLAFFSMPKRTIDFFLWSYSLWVESLAIFPQLILLGRTKKMDVMNREYIFFMAIYRAFYLLNWIYQLATETGRVTHVVWITGVIQTVIYSDYIYTYIKKKVTGIEFELPYS